MPHKKSIWDNPCLAVMTKDVLCEFRTRYAFGSLTMFALMTLSSVSMSIGSSSLPAEFAAVILWVVLFFCAMAGLSRSFVQEQEAGTMFTLRLYAGPQAVLFGKMIFNMLLLIALTILIIPLFILFLNVEIKLPGLLVIVLVLGDIGIVAVSTLTAAMLARTQGKGSLFTVLTFPVLLPQFLSGISGTVKAISGVVMDWQELIFMISYDVIIIIAASILFDYLWYD
ncbi:MAG: heme exporter protein CcmB [Sporomusaceae bacterium]|nr:heme exporter protein CcmB [Sporomusaceae bacterium]